MEDGAREADGRFMIAVSAKVMGTPAYGSIYSYDAISRAIRRVASVVIRGLATPTGVWICILIICPGGVDFDIHA